MKKIFFIAAASVLSVTAMMAQQSVPSPTGQTDSLRNNGSAKVDTTSLVRVKSAAIPTGLRSTLKDKQYSGWEKGTLYQDPKTKGYILQFSTETAGTSKNPNWYKFDSKGKLIPEPKMKIN